jgi:hypothetical protein
MELPVAMLPTRAVSCISLISLAVGHSKVGSMLGETGASISMLTFATGAGEAQRVSISDQTLSGPAICSIV